MPSRRREGFWITTDDETSARLANIRQKDTKPEQIVRKMLTALGARYRVRNKDLPGNPDIANRSKRWAIFVHGCYWHRHEGCGRTTTPKNNRKFWEAKFDRNVARDVRGTCALEELGYRVLVVWECEAEDQPEAVVRKLNTLLGGK